MDAVWFGIVTVTIQSPRFLSDSPSSGYPHPAEDADADKNLRGCAHTAFTTEPTRRKIIN